ncbi:hypothetical protein [Bradyrhizobium sp. CCBAU 51753]|uniref:hypothetical protein n=1 Tax=Bradyrhizobium sp. CCBAU 51753 TaxID=1325100 RepID=UPI001AEF14BC|nr:hypothetical protein [Bradyrhizobium sp. CCBAU 51753]
MVFARKPERGQAGIVSRIAPPVASERQGTTDPAIVVGRGADGLPKKPALPSAAIAFL